MNVAFSFADSRQLHVQPRECSADGTVKHAAGRLYGLPCPVCRSYYFSDESECPICRKRNSTKPPPKIV